MNSRLNGLAATKSACADSEQARTGVGARPVSPGVVGGSKPRFRSPRISDRHHVKTNALEKRAGMQPGIQQPETHAVTTRCEQCGAELRPGARFCNRCGAPQPAEGAAQAAAAAQPTPASQTPAAPPATAPQAAQQSASAPPSVAEAPAPSSLDLDDAARVKRPLRVPRMREGEETSEGEGEIAGNGTSAPAASMPVEALDPGPQPATTAQEEEEMPALAATDAAAQAAHTASPIAQAPAQAHAQAPAQAPRETSPAATSAPATSVEALAPPNHIRRYISRHSRHCRRPRLAARPRSSRRRTLPRRGGPERGADACG